MIRPARKEDAAEAVRLIYKTIGKIGNALMGSDDPQEVTRLLEFFFQQEGNRLSYENTLVQELDGQVLGVLVSYHGSQTETLDRPYVERLIAQTGDPTTSITKEALDDEYYLDTIAVDDRYQGRGFGRELMHAFEQKALQAGHRKLALLVEKSNDRAYRLYQKMGYVVDGTLQVSGYDMRHMIRSV